MIAGRDDLFCSLIFTEMEEEANTERHDSNIAILPGLVAHVGMKFRNSDEAWAFWLSHGGQKGFEDRKRYSNSEMRTTRSHGWTLPVLRKGNSRASAKAPISCPSNDEYWPVACLLQHCCRMDASGVACSRPGLLASMGKSSSNACWDSGI
nr:uncharacterized protein LOC117843740 isoform X3 [Setaria viridis]